MTKNNLFTWVMAGLMMAFMAAIGFAQEAKKGPRISLEEMEVTLFEDGKEIKKVIVSKEGKDQMQIYDDLHQKVLKKMGVAAFGELEKKKLLRKYDDEMGKSMKMRALAQPKLKFIDDNGNVKKEISLTNEKKQTKVKDNWAKREWEGESIVRNITVVVSGNQQFAVADTSLVQQPILTSEYLKVYEGAAPIKTGQVTLYDVSGEIRFKKDFPQGTEITIGSNIFAISDTGTIAFMTSEGQGENKKMYVYDKDGKELLVLPKPGESIYPLGLFELSPNGRYLSVDSTRGEAFINLDNKKSWIADKDYLVMEIDNSGIVKAYDQLTPVQIDLKKVIGD